VGSVRSMRRCGHIQSFADTDEVPIMLTRSFQALYLRDASEQLARPRAPHIRELLP
jgi:hypothetical protein